MAKNTRQLSGAGKDKFLRAIVAEISPEPTVAGRLGDALCGAIADVRVRRKAWQALSDTSASDTSVRPAAPPAAVAASAPSAPEPSFDPFAFSALSVLTKQGVDALRERLAGIASIEHLHALAKAQHLSIDPAAPAVDDVRAAILAATETRLAERRAAAS